MRKHVQKIAEQLGYRPDATVASLMAQLSSRNSKKFQSTLGFVNASENPEILREIPTFKEWARGAEDRARELGYGMDFFWLHQSDLAPARLKQILVTRGVRGLIVAAMQSDGVLPSAHAELWAEFSCIVIGLRPKEPALHFAANDQFATGAQAAEELGRLGYKRIGLVIDPEIDQWLEHRFSAGFFSGCNGAERLPIFEFRKDKAEAFGAWFRAHQPDALVTLHAEVKAWLDRLNIQTPGDVGLIHLDRESSMAGWAGMDQNSYCIGVAATDMIVGQLHRNEQGIPDFPKAILIQSKWTPGTTVRAQKKKKPRANRQFSKAK